MLAAALPTRLHTVDLALIVVYLIGITLFGLHFRGSKDPNTRSLRSYFLADQTIPWWAIALSIVSAETSTLTIISIPGLAFAGDFGFLQLVIGYMIGRVIVAILFLPKYFQGQMLTAYQLIDQRFGHTLHKVTAGLFLATRAAAEGVRVFAVSIVVAIAIGTGDVLSIGIISALTLLYTFEGGMAAVIWTDVVQMIIYIGGTLVAILTLGTHIPGGWAQIHEVAGAAGKFHLFHFALNLTESYTFWAGVLGGTFLTMASHGTDQLMVQRMLAARNLRQSQLALLSSGVVIFFQFTLFLLIGAGLYVFYGLHPAVFASGDRIFPTFIVTEMPIGIAGLLVAAILAAAMSNLSAALNSLSSTTVVDFYMHWRPQADERERMLISRSSTVLWAFILFAIAVYSIHAGGKGHVVEIGLSIASVAYGCLLGVFLLGTLTRYASQTGAILGMITGFALNLWLWQGSFPITLGPITIPHIAFTWYVLIGAIVTFAVGSLGSLVFRAKARTKTIVTTVTLLLCASLTYYASPQSRVPHLGDGFIIAKVGGSTAQTSAATASDFTPITTLVNEAIAAHKLPGAVVLIDHDGKQVFEQAYGSRKVAGELSPNGSTAAEPMTEDTIFDMASLSKCLSTATAMMQLYEQGKYQFDNPVAKYLPDFAANGKENVTIRELLTHYSGLPPDISLKDPWGLAAPDKAEGIRRALASPLKTTPGIHFEYSDINFITLGALVEKLSGESLDVYAAQHIFTPLGMKDTTYHSLERVCPHGFLRLGSSALLDMNHAELDLIGAKVEDYCATGTWNTESIFNTAPTAHDDEGTAATNPDFDHLLRGTVHDPTTRRMGGVAGHAGVFSTAHDVALFAQALLDKLTKDTGSFPLKQSTLKLMTEPEQPATAESTATVFTPDGKPTKGVATRGFGWDMNSAFSRPRGAIFPIGSFGHTGFTGTSLWMDPASDTALVILANAIHPRGNPPISALRGEIATAAARALQLEDPIATPTLTGIDVLESTHFEALREAAVRHGNRLRLGLLTNQTGLDSKGRRTVDILHADAAKAVPGLVLTTLFSPEHGLFGLKDTTKIANDTDPTTRLPILSLYGAKPEQRRPRAEDLAKLDAVVIDLQDAGVRFYTYETVVGYFLEAAAEQKAHGHNLEIIVLDRPNPIGGVQVQGPVSDPGAEAYIDYMPLPVRHGLTLGELALYFNSERRLPSPLSANVQVPIKAPLTVIPMQHWRRTEYFDETRLPWTNPSPNLRNLTAATLYPGLGFLDATDVSVGRGTSRPFEQIGASYIDAAQLAAYLTARKIPGVSFAPTAFSVVEDAIRYPGHGKTIPGIAFTLTDRNALNATELGIEVVSALHHLYPQFPLAKTANLIANAGTMQSLANHEDPRKIAADWAADLAAFRQKREPYLLYR
jgi:SSS family transporter